MLFDLHIHQDKHSSDSKLNILDAIKDAKALNLDGICITDHDDLGLRGYTGELSKEYNLLIISGVEIYTLDGDLLCYGIDELPDERMSAQDTIDYVHKRGGVCIAAHPYRHNNRGLGDKLYQVQGLDAIEGLNGRTDVLSNLKSVEVAKELNIPITGGSDAHSKGEIGSYITRFNKKIINEKDFIDAIKSGEFEPVSLKEFETKESKTA